MYHRVYRASAHWRARTHAQHHTHTHTYTSFYPYTYIHRRIGYTRRARSSLDARAVSLRGRVEMHIQQQQQQRTSERNEERTGINREKPCRPVCDTSIAVGVANDCTVQEVCESAPRVWVLPPPISHHHHYRDSHHHCTGCRHHHHTAHCAPLRGEYTAIAHCQPSNLTSSPSLVSPTLALFQIFFFRKVFHQNHLPLTCSHAATSETPP